MSLGTERAVIEETTDQKRCTERSFDSGRLRAPATLKSGDAALRAILFLTGAVYLPSIGYDFVFDDNQQILLNPWLVGWRHIGSFFTHHLWAFSQNAAYSPADFYRPVFLLWLLLLNHASSGIPGFFHLATIGLHLTAVYMVYRLALRLGGDRWVALVAALIFGVHPVHIEAVAWISGGTEPLFAVFYFGSLLCYLRSGDERVDGKAWLANSWFCFAMALFAKETAIVLPAVILVHRLSSAGGNRSARIRSILATLPYISVAMGYAICRRYALGTWSETRSSFGSKTILSIVPRVWWYVHQLFWPFHLSLYYKNPELSLLRAVTGGVLLILFGAIAIYKLRRHPGWATAAALSVFPLAPVLISGLAGDHDRYLYIPSFGFSLATAYVIGQARFRSARSACLCTPGIATVALALATALVLQEGVWNNDLSLFEHVVANDPEPRNISRLAATYAGLDERKQLSLLLDGIKSFPNSVVLHQELGIYYYDHGMLDEASEHLQLSIGGAGSSPIRARSLCYLGLIDSSKGNLAKAEPELQEAVRIQPSLLSCQKQLTIMSEKIASEKTASKDSR
jgi:protein O-mannosyl-transferase